MARWLVAFNGPASGEWLFLAITAHRSDAQLIADAWRDAQVFDLMEDREH